MLRVINRMNGWGDPAVPNSYAPMWLSCRVQRYCALQLPMATDNFGRGGLQATSLNSRAIAIERSPSAPRRRNTKMVGALIHRAIYERSRA